MRFNRTLAIGIVTCLALGVLIGASQATIEGTVDDSPMTIPIGRVGDQVTYAHFERPNDMPKEDMDSGSVSAGGGLNFLDHGFPDYQHSGAHATTVVAHAENGFAFAKTYLIAGLDVARDRTGERHDVVLVKSNQNAFGQPRTDRVQQESVDLESRFTILRVSDSAYDGGNVNFRTRFANFDIQEPSLSGLRFQGHTYALGADLSADLAAPPADPDVRDVESASDDPQVQSQSERFWVASRAIINERDSYALRYEATVSLQLTSEDQAVLSTMMGRPIGDSVRIVATRTIWVSAASPYPILAEGRVVADLEEEDFVFTDSYSVLEELRAGSGVEIPWGQDRSDRHFRETNPDIERTSSSQLFPADGTGSRLGYPLSQALRDAQNDLTLLEFRQWRERNPNHHLVSADLENGEHSTAQQPTHLWRLVFAVPTGKAYMVSTERVPAMPRAYTEERGELDVPAFAVADLPEHAVTIAAVERLWQDMASDDYKARLPDYVHWGYFTKETSGKTCPGTHMSQRGTNRDMLQYLEVGFGSWGSCLETTRSGMEFGELSVNLRSGNMHFYHEFASEREVLPLGAFSTESRTIQRESKTVPFMPRAPEVKDAAVASTSLLAAFLVLYFLPALKFVGLKGLLLVPGYAKLRKEDLLDNKIRDQILQVVRNDPGINTTDLAKRLDAGWGTTVYHLGVLEKNQMVSSLVDGRYHRFFPVGVMDFSERGQVAMMKNERTKTIYELIAQDPGIVQESLAQRVGISAPAAIFHLKRLEDTGLVGRVKKGRKVHYYANEKGRATPSEPSSGMEVQ